MHFSFSISFHSGRNIHTTDISAKHGRKYRVFLAGCSQISKLYVLGFKIKSIGVGKRPLMTSHVFGHFLPTFSYTITSNFGGYLGPHLPTLISDVINGCSLIINSYSVLLIKLFYQFYFVKVSKIMINPTPK